MRKPIPEPLYPCLHCSEDYSWPAFDLYWSELEKGWVCDNCWSDREANWDGEEHIEEEHGISLAEEIKAIEAGHGFEEMDIDVTAKEVTE